MANKIRQIRFPGHTTSFSQGWSNNLLPGPVTKLSIYALPGTTFKFTQTQSSEEVFVIGATGLFSIDVTDRYLTNLYVSQESYNNTISNNHFIIIDLIYVAKEEYINE